MDPSIDLLQPVNHNGSEGFLMTTLRQATRGCLWLRLTIAVGAALLCLVEPATGQVVVSGDRHRSRLEPNPGGQPPH